MKVSVIVPIYRVECFIERCARSLFQQTMREVEFIFVDDATPDKSMHILHQVIKDYPDRIPLVKLLTHKENKGLPATRNDGLSIASGEYIYHCDSDDYIEPDMLEVLYNTAKRENADIVWCDWFLSFQERQRYMRQPYYTKPLEAVKAMLSGGMKFNVWNKLVKHNLYVDNCIDFPSGNGMGEDMTMIMLFAKASKIAYVPRAFYHYVKTNTNAISQTYSAKHLQELHFNVARITDFLHNEYGTDLEREIAFMKLEVKFPFLLSEDSHKIALWGQWYPEANSYILSNKYISIRSRLLQWFAWKRMYWVVRLYKMLLNKIVYGLLYR